jgi:hypothetical protein
MAQLLSTRMGIPFNDTYQERPVWATVSSSGATAGTQLYLTFSANNPFVPMSFEYSGVSSKNTRLRVYTDETAPTYFWQGNSATQTTSETWAPSSGYIGVTYQGQTTSVFNFDGYDTGSWGFYNANDSFGVLANSGIMIGESSWNQTIDLLCTSGKVMLSPIGGSWPQLNNNTSNQQFFYMGTPAETYFSGSSGIAKGLGKVNITSGSATSWVFNYGMICHNRNSGKLAYLEKRTSAASDANYRLHILDLQNKIGKTTTTGALKGWLDAAVAAGTSRYNYYDITLPTPSYLAEQVYQLKVVLCDDSTVWLGYYDHDNSSTAGAARLYRCIDTTNYATWTNISNVSTTTSYGIAQGLQYGYRHMNSDDNSRILMWSPYYYYHSGMCGHCVDTATATGATSGVGAKWSVMSDTSSQGRTIAPKGGKSFVYCDSTVNNDSGRGVALGFLDFTTLDGMTRTAPTYSTGYYPSMNTSTWYGGNAVIKVMPTQEWK